MGSFGYASKIQILKSIFKNLVKNRRQNKLVKNVKNTRKTFFFIPNHKLKNRNFL